MRKLLLLVSIFIAVGAFVQAQSKSDLEKQRKQIQKEIEELRSNHTKVKKSKQESLGQLARVRALIKKRDAVIANINKQVKLIDDDINQNNKEINRLKSELDTLKLQYAKTIEYAYKNRSNYDMMNFIFSAANFNDAIKRVTYLKAYRTYREKQVENIYNTQALLTEKNNTLSSNKNLKSQTLNEQSKEMQKLELERKEKNRVVADLNSREKEINNQLANKRKLENNIKNSIAAIIKREIAAAEKAERAKRDAAAKANTSSATTTAAAKPVATNRSANKLEMTPEVTAVSVGFENNQKKLPWPVSKGNVSGKFGRNKIEDTRIIEDNIGIYIQTDIGIPVTAVFEGTVSSVHNIGGSSAVTVRHGKYLTTYYNLTNVSVTKDQQLKLGHSIGKAAESEDEDGIGKVLFVVTEVVGNTPKYLNPENWLKPR